VDGIAFWAAKPETEKKPRPKKTKEDGAALKLPGIDEPAPKKPKVDGSAPKKPKENGSAPKKQK
jgi:hypothetical protein